MHPAYSPKKSSFRNDPCGSHWFECSLWLISSPGGGSYWNAPLCGPIRVSLSFISSPRKVFRFQFTIGFWSFFPVKFFIPRRWELLKCSPPSESLSLLYLPLRKVFWLSIYNRFFAIFDPWFFLSPGGRLSKGSPYGVPLWFSFVDPWNFLSPGGWPSEGSPYGVPFWFSFGLISSLGIFLGLNFLTVSAHFCLPKFLKLTDGWMGDGWIMDGWMVRKKPFFLAISQKILNFFFLMFLVPLERRLFKASFVKKLKTKKYWKKSNNV